MAAEGDRAAVAVLDVGKTNVKLSAVSAGGRVHETLAVENPVRPGPPWRHHDLAALNGWVLESLAALARRHPLERVIATGHGSSGVLVGDDPDAGGDGTVLPMPDYEQPLPDEVARDYEALAGDALDRGSMIQFGATHLARQLLWAERQDPASFARARAVLCVPQYWAWRLSGLAALEPSILGAQTHLWSAAKGGWTPIVAARGWGRLLPPLRRAWDDLGPVRDDLVRRHGIPAGLRVHLGAHDSTANAYRYRAAGREDLLVVSTGTWLVGLAGGVPMGRFDAPAGMTVNADLEGRPVLGTLAMAGREFAHLAGEPDGRPADMALVRALVARGTMALPSFGGDTGQFPGTAGRGRVLGPPPEGPAERLALAVLHMALLTWTAIGRLEPERGVVLDGSFLSEPLFAPLVAALRPGRETLDSPEPYGVAAGAALIGGHLSRDGAAEVALRASRPAVVPGLETYARRWAGLAMGTT